MLTIRLCRWSSPCPRSWDARPAWCLTVRWWDRWHRHGVLLPAVFLVPKWVGDGSSRLLSRLRIDRTGIEHYPYGFAGAVRTGEAEQLSLIARAVSAWTTFRIGGKAGGIHTGTHAQVLFLQPYVERDRLLEIAASAHRFLSMGYFPPSVAEGHWLGVRRRGSDWMTPASCQEAPACWCNLPSALRCCSVGR